MRTKITFKLDTEFLREVRAVAAAEGQSVCALLSHLLEELVRERLTYGRARRRALDRLQNGRDLGWTPAASRDVLHQR